MLKIESNPKRVGKCCRGVGGAVGDEEKGRKGAEGELAEF